VLENNNIGIMLVQDSHPEVRSNTVYNNDSIGVFLMDHSQGHFNQNHVFLYLKPFLLTIYLFFILFFFFKINKNEIDFVVEKYSDVKYNFKSNN
jgi:parallel beta-helix repeat protein